MKTDELIVQLARSARPIRPLPGPAVRAMQWFAGASLLMIVAIAIIGPRADFIAVLGQPVFLASFVALLLTLVGGTLAAFLLSVPGAERSPAQHVLPVLTAAAWLALWLVVMFVASVPAGPRTAPFHLACAIEIAAGALLTGALLLVMIARAAPLRPVWTAAVASLASVATGAVLAQVLCPLDDPRHQLIGHVLVALVVAVAGLFVGRRTLTRAKLTEP